MKITPKDLKDISFLVKNNIDMIAVPGINNVKDVKGIKRIVNNPKIKILVMITTKECNFL